MFFTRRHRQLFAWALLIASLFAQGAIAASGCLMSGSLLSTVIADTPNPHCDNGKMNPNLCLVYNADQSDNNSAQWVAVASAPVVVMFVFPPQPAIALPRQNSQPHSPPTDPPIPIRNCCFRI
jgi:hypothetical protein